MPFKSKFFAEIACLIATALSPVSIENPNFTSSMPVVVYPCVWASTDGDNLSIIPWVLPF